LIPLSILKVAESDKQLALIISEEDEIKNFVKNQNEISPIIATNYTRVTSLNNKGVKVTLRNFGKTVPVANTNPSKACLLS
jgi:hypothetical protein